jgi:hypothetical protein
MRFLLAFTAAASLAACSHNKAAVDTGPETGRVATDTVRTTGVAHDTAHAVVTEKAAGVADTSAPAQVPVKAAEDSAPHAPTVLPDSAKAPPDSM